MFGNLYLLFIWEFILVIVNGVSILRGKECGIPTTIAYCFP